MLKVSELEAFLDIPVEVEAVLGGLSLSVGNLLSLSPGRIVTSNLPAGVDVDVAAGGAAIGRGELTVSRGRLAVRIVGFREMD